MEFTFSLVLLTLSFLFLLSKLLLGFRRQLITTSKTSVAGAKLPPGPSQLPIIGNLHNLAGSLPHRALLGLSRKHGPLIYLKLGETSAVVVSSPEAAREVLKNHDPTFASRADFVLPMITSYGGRDIVYAPYGEYWRQARKLCVLELLSAKRVHSFRRIREEEVTNLLRRVSDSCSGSPANLTEMVNSYTNDVAMRSSIGRKSKEQAEFLSLVSETIDSAAGFDLSDIFPSSRLARLVGGTRKKALAIQRRLDGVLGRIIAERRDVVAREKEAAGESSTEDLLDVLLRIQATGGIGFELSDDSIKGILLDMFAAGGETSSTLTLWVMSELMRNPTAMEKATTEVRKAFGGRSLVSEEGVQGLSYLKLVIKETLRLHAPLPLLIPRRCSKVCEVGGYAIPEGARVFVNVWALGRDPGSWESPEEFRPERFETTTDGVDFRGNNFEFLPFGAGRRICPGIAFGLANVELPLAHLLYCFDWKLAGGGGGCVAADGSLDMTEAFGVTLRRKNDLCLIAVPRLPCMPDVGGD